MRQTLFWRWSPPRTLPHYDLRYRNVTRSLPQDKRLQKSSRKPSVVPSRPSAAASIWPSPFPTKVLARTHSLTPGRFPATVLFPIPAPSPAMALFPIPAPSPATALFPTPAGHPETFVSGGCHPLPAPIPCPWPRRPPRTANSFPKTRIVRSSAFAFVPPNLPERLCC